MNRQGRVWRAAADMARSPRPFKPIAAWSSRSPPGPPIDPDQGGGLRPVL